MPQDLHHQVQEQLLPLYHQTQQQTQSGTQQSGFLAEEVMKGKQEKENVVDIRNICSSAITMDPGENISNSSKAYVSKAITMETEVTANAIDHQGRLNANATHDYPGLNDIKKPLNTCSVIAKSSLTKQDDSSDNTKQELQGKVLKTENVFDHSTVSSSLETSKVIYATIHKDYSAVVLAEETANRIARKDLEMERKVIAKKPLSAATIPAEGCHNEMVENSQTGNKVEQVMALASSTGSRKKSSSKLSVFISNGVICEDSTNLNQREENANSFSTVNLCKLSMKSPDILATSQVNKSMISLSATDPSGKKSCYLGSDQTSNCRLIYQQESENLPSTIQNEPLPITSPSGQYEDMLESHQMNTPKLFQKHSNTNQHERSFIQKNGSAESLTSLNRKLVLEIMELHHHRLRNNPSQNGKVQIKPRRMKVQSDKPFHREKQKAEVPGSQMMDTEHMDFATARKQWLKREALSMTHGSMVKDQKSKMVSKHFIKEQIDNYFDNKSKKHETTSPDCGSLCSEGKRSTGIKNDEAECLRKSMGPTQDQAMVASEENNDTVGDLNQRMLLNTADLSPFPEGSDSGLDDWTFSLEGNNLPVSEAQDQPSYSGHMVCEMPETPIEKEIRLSLNRETSLRKARGMTIFPCPEKFVEFKTRSLTFPPLPSSSSFKVRNNQLAEMHIQHEMLLERQRKADLKKEGKIMGKHGEDPAIEERRKFFQLQNPFPSPFPNKMLVPPINTPVRLLVSPPIRRSPFRNETNVSNVVIVQDDQMTSEDKAEVNDAIFKNKYPNGETANIVILETPNLIIQRSSCLPLPSNSSTEREDTLQNNPFFKLRSYGSESIIGQEIREVLQREDELHKQRCNVSRASEKTLRSSTAADNLLSGHKSNKNLSQECPGTALGNCTVFLKKRIKTISNLKDRINEGEM
ncbi:uncharacterized protein [Narcine bancroftii]|uniref:uncharacterized protein isoform X2 n=1 Tax=Narcine bancroftii TaxID=1343680 RepID=UPI0038321BD1